MHMQTSHLRETGANAAMGAALPVPHWALPGELDFLLDEPSTLQDLLVTFVVDAEMRSLALASALEAQDFETMRYKGHSLKGSAAQIGAPALAAFAGKLEISASLRQEGCGALVRQMLDEVRVVSSEIREFISGGLCSGQPGLLGFSGWRNQHSAR